MVLTSDGDSGDSKIIVKSVEGEEDLVDVTMKDAPKSSKSTKAYVLVNSRSLTTSATNVDI